MEQLQIQMFQATKAFYTADYEESKIIFEQLLKAYKKRNDARNIVRCLYRLSCLAYTRGQMPQFHELVKQFQNALTEKLSTILEHLIEQQMLYGLQAMAYLKYSKAIPHFSKVVALSQNAKYKKQKISALLFLQKCQIIVGNNEQAIKESDAIWADYKELIQEDTQQYLHYVLNRAHAFIQLKNVEAFEETIQLCEQHPDFHLLMKEQIFTAILRSKHLALTNNYIGAIKLLQVALSQSAEMHDMQMQYMMYSSLIDYFEQIQNHKEALHYAKLLMNIQRYAAIVE